MIKVTLGKLMSVSVKELNDGFRGIALLEFNGGSVEVTSTQMLIIRIVWEQFSPLIHEFRKEFIPTLENLSDMFDAYLLVHGETYGYNPKKLKEFRERFGEAQFQLHDITWDLGYKFNVGLTLYDIRKPYMEIKPYMELFKAGRLSIQQVYDIIKLNFSKDNVSNLALLYNKKMIKQAQIHILFGPRGRLSDTDGMVFKETVKNSLLNGLVKPSYFFYESRTLAKSHEAANNAIGESDKMAKAIRWVTSNIRGINMVDCGTTRGIPYEVKTERHLEIIHNRWMIEDNNLILVTKDNDHLIGKTVELRSPLACNAGTEHLCSVCYGKQSHFINPNDNLGADIASEIGGLITSKHLASKHHIDSAKAMKVTLRPRTKLYFENKNDGIYFKKDLLEKEGVSYELHFKEKLTLPFCKKAEDTSSITEVVIRKTKGSSIQNEPLDLSSDGTPLYFSDEYLEVIKKECSISRGTFKVPIKEVIMFRVKDREYSFKSFTEEAKNVLLNEKKVNSPKTAMGLLGDLINLTLNKVELPLNALELITKAFTMNEKGIPCNFDESHKVEGLKILQHRNLATLLSADNVNATLSSPEGFFEKPLYSPMEQVYLPNKYFPTENANNYVMRE